MKITTAFKNWLGTQPAFHGIADVGDEWLTTDAWPDDDLMLAAREVQEQFEAGNLIAASEAMIVTAKILGV